MKWSMGRAARRCSAAVDRGRTAIDNLDLWLMLLHIAAAITWIGGLLALGVVTARLARSGDGAAFLVVRRQSTFFGQAIVAPAAVVTLLAGGAMVARLGLSFTTLWVVWGVVGIAASLLLGAFPLRRAGEAADSLAVTAPDDPRLRPLQNRLVALSALNLLLLASVVWAMVFKPTL
jgi:putative copper export protein